QVQTAKTISVVGGDITVQGGGLKAPSGRVQISNIGSEVLLPTLQTAPNINGDFFSNVGTITLLLGANVDTNGSAAGTVLIRSGKLTMAGASKITTTATLGNVLT